MSMLVPYLSDEKIERDAAALLAEYGQKIGAAIVLPVPIEDIIEKYLKLGIEFDDTHRRFGVPRSRLDGEPDILGAIFFDERRIVIDESLDPEESPHKEGRYRFTLAHEGGGHWRLHHKLFANNPAQAALFPGPATPAVICRSSQVKERVEWQADFYASCLLMPRNLVMEAWNEMFPDSKSRVIAPLIPIDHPYVELRRVEHQSGFLSFKTVDNMLDDIANPLSEKFLVSISAMRIRLEKLGLLLREVPHQRIFASHP